MGAEAQGWNWIGEEVALAAHDALLAEFGGGAGVRDLGALQSALARKLNLAAYGSPGAAELAAAYAYGIVRNHPFTDGNKRTGFSLALVFLLDNGFDFSGNDVESVETMLELAESTLSEAQMAEWLRARIVPL